LTLNRDLKIAIIGAGNIAWHLGHALSATGYEVAGIRNRDKSTGEELAAQLQTTWSNDLAIPAGSCDLIVLAVNDSALRDVAQQLESSDAVVVHTAGSLAIDCLKRFDRFGVFYPFQTLTRGIPSDFSKIPLCIEASDIDTQSLLLTLAESLSGKVSVMASPHRKKLHLAGIILNNFSNHLITRATDYAEKNGLDPELLFPLLKETVNKLQKTSPETAQPAPPFRSET